ncbi:hypothetical protein DAPPUDRAFT_234972 [Daphnia pulex]|uniref:Transmembrane protein n=1 Tax=Daphnia pulex TaxID=6669 RepID=E9FXW5_DAPPU|nr:hypothetical protein DAPPUDRAFT_234972 [Daphnia pulex]|eukprot:EFX88221.1 hypothetical protein DAPPUDRAFT_234972 [Daphnia pulex]
MTKFEKLKNATSKSTKFLSSKKHKVVLLMLLVAWLIFACSVKKPEAPSVVEKKPIKVRCNDNNINHPMASGAMSSWKSFFVLFGLAWFLALSIGIPLSYEFKRIGQGTTFLKFGCRCLLWIVSVFTGLLFVGLWTMDNGPTETLAPNFLAACKPHGLDLLCSPDSHPEDWNPVVWVNCTTPSDMWMPALSNSLPILVAIQAYLMVIAFATCIHYFDWKTIWGQVSGLITQVINVALTVCTGCFIIFCNDANFNADFVSGYVKSAVVACACIAIDYYWCETGIEDQELPRYWNDVLNKEIIPEIGQLPTNLIPLRYELDNNLATTRPIAGDDDIDANPPPYSKLRSSGNDDPPPDYDKSFSLIQL